MCSILYWVEGPASIVRASMDGSSARAILTVEVNLDGMNWRIGGLAIGAHKVYWTVLNKRGIERCNFDGSGRESLQLQTEIRSGVLTVLNNWIYWWDWEPEDKRFTVQRANPNRVDSTTEVYAGQNFPRQVIVIPEDDRMLKELPNPCYQSQCSDLCALSLEQPEGFVCLCDQGSSIHTDGKNCGGL